VLDPPAEFLNPPGGGPCETAPESLPSERSMEPIRNHLKKMRAVFTARKAVTFLAAVVFIGVGVDYFVGDRQEAFIKAREARFNLLEQQAFYMLSIDVRDIRESENIMDSWEYIATIRMDNVDDDPVYISHPEVRAFMQVGTISWVEIPLLDIGAEEAEQIYKLETGPSQFQRILKIDPQIPYNRYLLPRYMHIKFLFRMSVLPESGFEDGEVFERKSEMFVYLKPYWVSKAEMKSAIDFGDREAPVYLPYTGVRIWD
jgi:hypothetical protein